MQDDIKLRMSMLLDDELSADDALRLLDRTEKDDEMKHWWSRLNATSVAIKSKCFIAIDDDFVKIISERIKREPIVLAPRRERPGLLYSGWAAVAASIFVLAVLVVGNLPDRPDESAQMMIAQSKSQPAAAQSPDGELDREGPAADPAFMDYLEAHNESSYATVTPSLLPYARVVTYAREQ